MLRTHEKVPKAKAIETNVEIYDWNNNLVRLVASAGLDGFVDAIDLPDGLEAYNIDMIPIRLKGVEAAWTEGDGETVFVWDCRNELGEPVKQGVYRIDISQRDAFGHEKRISESISIKVRKAA